MEPPPVYSSLSDNGLFFRTEQKKRSLWLSPFTARKDPKKFAVFHIVSSCVFLVIGIAISATMDSHRYSFPDPVAKVFILFICVPPLPFFLSALFGIRKSRQTFVLPIAVYMLISSALLCLSVLAFFGRYIVPDLVTGDNAHGVLGWLFFMGWFFLGLVSVPLLYTSHAARLYLRVYVDIRDEDKERASEKKAPLIA